MKRIIIVLLACATIALAGIAWIGGSNNNVSHAKTGKVEASKIEAGKVANAKFTTPIANGTEAVPHSLPWMVSIRMNNGPYCSGVIISNEWVLTAAHCVSGFSSFRVIAGAHNKDISESTQVVQISTNGLVHEDYGSTFLRNDLGLIRLPQPLSFNSEIQAINLDGSGNDWTGQVATIVGWGRTANTGNTSDVLRQAQAPIIPNAECASVYGSITVRPSTFCTSGTGGIGGCGGDSGGALIIGNTLVGTTSFSANAGCDLGYPTGFSSTSYFRDWIRTNTGI